ncbi:tryptophan--tRNA ligase [candidate division TA06 bacterium]|uniref:Tryptophan--tRNA ligase n=1 Tax=candidate division TA06 bacterium TaxID=2250710 RepID=A0A660SCT6_UNCT6|nr:MAG: tryptophan--tRNA ligase [candidate division TA06 bacterium]
MRVLSGIQPSGSLHIGNYFAMMKRMIEYQNSSDLFCFIVNYHALTTVIDGKTLAENTLNAAIDFLSLGIDPNKSVFFVQSDVPEVTELTWILSNQTPVGLLQRAHSYKDKIAKGISPNHGLFSYPVLMAADILLYSGEKVPVGKDQKQHVEIARDIAIKFNNVYGDVLVIPEPDIDKNVATVPGIDGQKMSKSYNNTIKIFAREKEIKKAVMSIVTDSTPVDQPKDPDKSVLFKIYSLFLDKNEKEQLRDRFLTPGLRYGDVKKELFARIMDYFAPFRERQQYYMNHREEVINILEKGAEKAKEEAGNLMEKVRSVTGLNYREVR